MPRAEDPPGARSAGDARRTGRTTGTGGPDGTMRGRPREWWPATRAALIEEQLRLADAGPDPWGPDAHPRLVAGCFICFAPGPGPGEPERAWAAAALSRNRHIISAVVATGSVTFPYQAGLLALREGPLLEDAVRALPERPDLLLVNATGRDHPRRAGLALHLGAVLEVPTAGVTDRPLVAAGAWPPDERRATTPLVLEGETVGYWLRSRTGARPVAVHAAWRTTPDVAVASVGTALRRARTPEPIRRARRAARLARAGRDDTAPP